MNGPRGTSLPRLQEFAFLEHALAGVIARRSYEEIRQSLIGYMASTRDTESLGGNTARHQLGKEKLGRPAAYEYADNVTSALKELMSLGLVERASLPSSGKVVPHYAGTQFQPTQAGLEYADLARADWWLARDRLLALLTEKHPQVAGYIRILERGGLVIPLANWGHVPEPRTRPAYVDLLAMRGAALVGAEDAGWTASADDIRGFVRDYVDRIAANAAKRAREDAFKRNEDFVRQCEKAMVRLAFDRAGSPTDYISFEIIRRWLRDLDVAAFSYHVPGPPALRIWRTAELTGTGAELKIRRRNDDQALEAVARGLRDGYEIVRSMMGQEMPWVPAFQLRAAVCYRLEISDKTFDRAINEVFLGRLGSDLPFKVSVDQYQYGNTPPTERPLRLRLKGGEQDVHSITLLPRTNPQESEVH